MAGARAEISRRSWWWRGLAVLCLSLAGILVFLIKMSYIFGAEPVRYALAGAVSLATGGVAVWLWSLSRSVAPERARVAGESIALLLGVVGTLYSTAGLLVGGNPPNATASPCEGVPDRGGAFQVVTPPRGVTTRRAPNILAQQSGRLGSSCAVRIDGYCYGTPIDDISDATRNDSRWLRVYRVTGAFEPLAHFLSGGSAESQFIAAGTIFSQVSDEVLPHLSSADCTVAGEPREAPAPAPAALSRIRGESTQGVEYFRVRGDYTFDFGFALAILGPSRTGDPYRHIPTLGPDDKAPAAVLNQVNDITRVAEWRPSATSKYLIARTSVIVVGVGCLGIGVPATIDIPTAGIKAYQVRLDGSFRAQSKIPNLESDTRVTEADLARAACREASP